MRLVKTLTVGMVLCLLCLIVATTAMAEELIVVASEATFEASQKWVDFLTLNEVPLKHVTPQEFDKVKKSKYLVIMGGLDEANGIKGIAKELLDDGEFKDISQKGNGDIFFKFQKWDPMQTIIMFVGSDMAAADKARQESREDWWNSFILWFDLDADMEGFHVY